MQIALQLRRRARDDDPTVVDDRERVGEAVSFLEVVRGEKHGDPLVVREPGRTGQRANQNLPGVFQADAFKGKEADATVSFRPKGSGPGSGLQMRYTLEQKSGKWVVKEKSQAGGVPAQPRSSVKLIVPAADATND